MSTKFNGQKKRLCRWYHAEQLPSADAHDDFLDYMPWAYNTTPEIRKAVVDGMKALTDAEDNFPIYYSQNRI